MYLVMELEEDWESVTPAPGPDIDWLQKLNDKLWPKEQREKGRAGKVQLKLEAKRELSEAEWARVRKAIEAHKLVVEMIGTNMFGGVGIRLFTHPPVPGVDEADLVLILTEEHVFGDIGATGGNCNPEAYEAFFELANTEDNRRWCKQYKLKLPREQTHYCY